MIPIQDSDVVEHPGPNHAISQLKLVGLVGSLPTSLRHLLGLLNSEMLIDVDFIQPPVGTIVIWPTKNIYISIRKIRLQRDLVSLYFKFIHLSFLWLFHNIGCS